MNQFVAPAEIEIDPRPCEHCGLTLEQHLTVEGLEGDEHYCQPLDVALYLAAIEQQERWERADPRDAWRHTGAARPPDDVRNGPPPQTAPYYRTPQSTVDAFWCVVREGNEDKLIAWLGDRPRDAPHLLQLMEGKANA